VFKLPKQQLSSNYYSTINWIDNNIYKIIISKEEHKQETLEELKKWKQEALIAHEINQKVIEKLMAEKKLMYSEEEVELIANEMVNWAIDNIGNPLPQSGKKFDEVIAKFKNK
jgi:cell division ATPase FtsA